jgi:hypothetical protein
LAVKSVNAIQNLILLPGSEGVVGERERVEGKGGCAGKGGEMTQTLYAHMNKRNKKTK